MSAILEKKAMIFDNVDLAIKDILRTYRTHLLFQGFSGEF